MDFDLFSQRWHKIIFLIKNKIRFNKMSKKNKASLGSAVSCHEAVSLTLSCFDLSLNAMLLSGYIRAVLEG